MLFLDPEVELTLRKYDRSLRLFWNPGYQRYAVFQDRRDCAPHDNAVVWHHFLEDDYTAGIDWSTEFPNGQVPYWGLFWLQLDGKYVAPDAGMILFVIEELTTLDENDLRRKNAVAEKRKEKAREIEYNEDLEFNKETLDAHFRARRTVDMKV